MQSSASQYINDQRQHGNIAFGDKLVNLLNQIAPQAQDDIQNLKDILNVNREYEITGNWQRARINDLKDRTKRYPQGAMTEIQNYELISSYYAFQRELNRRIRFDQRVGNIEETKIEKIDERMLVHHTKKTGTKKRITMGMNPWNQKFEYVLEYSGEAHYRNFDDCLVNHITVPGIDFYETTKKILEECEKCGATRKQLAEIIYTMVIKEVPVISNSIKRRSTNPNVMLESMYDLFTQDDTIAKIDETINNQIRYPRQDIATFAAKMRELLIHKLQLTQPNLSEAKQLETSQRITRQYCLDVVTEPVRKEVTKLITKKNKEGREFEYTSFISFIQMMENDNDQEHLPKFKMQVKSGMGSERISLAHSNVAAAENVNDLPDMTQPVKRENRDGRRNQRGRSHRRDKNSKSRDATPRNRRSSERRDRSASAQSSRENSRSSSKNGRDWSRGSRNSYMSRSSRSGSASSAGNRSRSRSLGRNSDKNSSSSHQGNGEERESNFNVDSRRRSNKPNKENYNKNREQRRNGSRNRDFQRGYNRDRSRSRGDDRNKKDNRKKEGKSAERNGDSDRKKKLQKVCDTCATVNTCPVRKCLKYPQEINCETECPRCRQGCHSQASCIASKN